MSFSDEIYQFVTKPSLPLSESMKNEMAEFNQLFSKFRDEVAKGKYGKTAQFWCISLDLMKMQHWIHIAVKKNDFELQIKSWEFLLPFYFALNKINYPHYGSYYVETLKLIEIIHPGLTEMLKKKKGINCPSSRKV